MTTYDAFISYGQAADGELAEALQVGLQRLAKPWTKRRAMEVFRDATGLSASPDLRGTLLASLTGSRFVILLASPDAAASPWVNDELSTFIAQDELAWQRVIIVVTDGEWQWAGDGHYTPESTAVPKALVGAFRTEPLFVDMRWAKGVTGLTLASPRFKAAVADIASPIRGISEDELVGEDVRLFKLAKRLRWSAVIGLSLLLVASLIASAVAISNGREAVRQKNAAQEQTARAVASEQVATEERDRAEAATAEAIENAAVARSGELATAALATMADDPEVAAALAVESLYPNDETEMRRSPQADNAVGVTGRGLEGRLFAPVDQLPDATDGIPVASVGRYIAMVSVPSDVDACWPRYVDGVGEPTSITWWDRDSREAIDGVPPGVELSVSFLSTASNVLRIDDARTVTPIAGAPIVAPGRLPANDGIDTTDVPAPECSSYGSPATYNAASNTIVSFDATAAEFVAADALTGEVRSRMSRPGVPLWQDVAVAAGIVFAVSDEGRSSIWSLVGGGAAPADGPFSSQWVEGALDWIVSSGSALRIDLTTGLTPLTMQGGLDFATQVAISPDGRFVAETDGTRVEIWQLDNVVSIASMQLSFVSSVFWAGDELVVVSARGTEVYGARQPETIDDVVLMAVSADGSVMAGLAGDFSTLDLYDTTSSLDGSVESFAASDSWGPPTDVSPDGSLLLLQGPEIVLRSVPSGEVVYTGPSGLASFDPTGSRLAVSPYTMSLEATAPPLEIVDTDDGTVTATIPALAVGGVTDIVWLAADRVMVRGLDGGLRSARLVADEWSVEEIAWPSAAGGVWVGPDLGLLAVADLTGRLELLSFSPGDEQQPAQPVQIVAGTTIISDVTFDPELRQMVTVAGSEVILWDISDATPRRVQTLSELPVLLGRTLSFGIRVAFGGDDRFLFVHYSDTIVVLPGFDPVRICAALSDDDLARAKAIIGNDSACTRIPELSAAG